MSDSTWNDPRITAYALDEMTPEDRSAFEQELKSDSQLQAAVDEARSITTQLADFFEQQFTPPLESDRRKQILFSESGESPTTTQASSVEASTKAPSEGSHATTTIESRRQGLKIAAVAIATAAIVLLLIGIAPRLMDNAEIAWRAEGDAFQDVAHGGDPAQEVTKELPNVETQSDALSMLSDEEAGEMLIHEGLEVRPRPESARSRRLAEVADADVAADDFERLEFSAANVNEETGLPPTAGKQERSRRVKPPAVRRPAVASSNRKDADSPFSLGLQPGQDSPEQPKALKKAKKREISPSSPLTALAPASLSQAETFHRSSGGYGGGLGPESERGLSRGEAPLGEGESRLSLEKKVARYDVDYGLPVEEGRGPGIAGDQFDPITDNPFKRVSEHPLSTFSIDVDTASYSKVRDTILRAGRLPRPDAVRIEEMVNYFDYSYQPPPAGAEHPFAVRADVTSCPWNEGHRLARVSLKGKELSSSKRPARNLVFLLDTSGSMNASNKLPLVQTGMKMLLKKLDGNDRVAIVVYAGSAGKVLDSTGGDRKRKIRRALTRLAAGGSTNGGAGITLAYQTAREHFIDDGVNRVILCTDGDFNVGTTGTDQLVRLVEQEAKAGIYLTVLGFGMGNHNDAMLEQISGRGNGNYAFIDNVQEAQKVLVEQTDSTLVTIAKDVKLQIEFNPAKISTYRLIGYENRVLAKEDFNDDTKDAGEIGAGHSVTAFYELVPADLQADAVPPQVDPLKYQSGRRLTEAAESADLMTLALRYKQPDAETSTRLEVAVGDSDVSFDQASENLKFAAAVAGFGMQLRRSPYAGSWTLGDVNRVAQDALGDDPYGLRAQFLELVGRAMELTGQESER